MKGFGKKGLTLAVVIFGAVGCANATDDRSVEDFDNTPIRVSVDGRGDSNGVAVTMDELEIVLEIANTYHVDELDAFLDVRAARNIVDERADRLFTTLDQLDDVPYVGARAFDAFLQEARTFQVSGNPDAYDVRDYFEAGTDPYAPSAVQLQFRGELATQLADQPFVGNLMRCGADGQCNFHYKFDKIRDYSETAGPGNVVMSFRTEDVSNSSQNSGLTRLARNVVESRFDGPMECTELPAGRCVPLYGCGGTQYRCSVRIPE